MSRELEARALLRRACELPEAELTRLLKGLPGPVRRAIDEGWWAKWHEGQVPKDDDWDVWLLRGGRGFGKTRAGAEWVWARARENPRAQIALVGANLDDVVKVMVEGPGGLVAAARSGEAARWVASRRRVDFSSGAMAFAYSAERPEKLRGPEHDHAWCDELGKWANGDRTWDNLMLGLRRGTRPRTIVTTTPRTVALLRRIRGLAGFCETRGRTLENRHLAEAVKAGAYAAYGGTRLGRQELDAEMFEDIEGALWTRELIEKARIAAPRGGYRRVVVGVDPPVSVEGDACGIVVCALGADGTGYVLADHSAGGLSPEGWALKVAGAAEAWRAHKVVAEKNNGGLMVESVLRGADVSLPVKLVHAADGKSARAEPVAALFESGRAKLAGAFPELEDEMCALVLGGGYEGKGSPDRADAMVWAMTELMLGERRAEPRVRRL
ncbi:MAG TPA: terminase family protein [Allosphingosinicella sp.]|nr:terminase family protein [Allosphingosinicella sp.]